MMGGAWMLRIENVHACIILSMVSVFTCTVLLCMLVFVFQVLRTMRNVSTVEEKDQGMVVDYQELVMRCPLGDPKGHHRSSRPFFFFFMYIYIYISAVPMIMKA